MDQAIKHPVVDADLALEDRDFSGCLMVVGLGLRVGHLTLEGRDAIESADVVFTVTNNFVSTYLTAKLNSNVQDLREYYEPDKPRMQTYEEMVERVLAEVRRGKKVCFAAYGHAGVFAYPTHTAIRRARQEGYLATMLPGISAEDCIFADLGIDPANSGCQSFEATDFVARERIWDPYSTLIMWQISVIAISRLPLQNEPTPGLPFLVEKLVDVYGPHHPGILYEAPPYPLCHPRREEVVISTLTADMFRPQTTFVVKPLLNCPRKHEVFSKLIH